MKTRWMRCAAVAAAVLAPVTHAAAQGTLLIAGGGDEKQPVDVRPPAPGDPGGPSVLLYILTFGLGAAAVGLAVMPSRRTHQD